MKKYGLAYFSFFLPALLLGCAFSCSGTPQTAEKTEKTEPPSIENALKHYYGGRIEDAALEFEAVLHENEHENDVFVMRQLAVIYRETGNFRALFPVLETLAENDETLRHDLFTAYYLAGEKGKAAAYREKAAAVQPANSKKKADFLFINAMLAKDEGGRDRAAGLLRESLELERYRPIAWFTLGELLSPSAEAETCYRTALSQDSALTEALYPLGKALAARKAWGQAEVILARAARRYPDDRNIAAALAGARRYAGGGGADINALLRRKITANPPRVKPLPDIPGEGLIRIGLAERRELVSVKTGGSFRIKNEAGSVVYRGKNEQFWVPWNTLNGELSVQGEDGRVLARQGKKFVMEYVDPSDTSIVAGVVSGYPETYRTYRGELEFAAMNGGMTVINILNTEEYLYGVIPAEMPASWPEEALKAQAIAARSYSIAQHGQFADKGFDLYGTPHSMAYHGVGVENKNTTSAVDLTRGVVLRGGTETLKAYFSANHGGYSEDSLTMWGHDAYMAAVPDMMLSERTNRLPLNELDDWIREAPLSFSSVNRYHFSSSYRWEKWVAADEIRRRLKENYGEDPGEIRSIVSRGRGISGRVYELEVTGRQKSVRVKGDSIWSAMGALRSSLFTISYKLDKNGNPEYVIFRGAGHGHGIGLDQHGAAGMASAGYKAEEILRHYYPKAEIIRL